LPNLKLITTSVGGGEMSWEGATSHRIAQQKSGHLRKGEKNSFRREAEIDDGQNGREKGSAGDQKLRVTFCEGGVANGGAVQIEVVLGLNIARRTKRQKD